MDSITKKLLCGALAALLLLPLSLTSCGRRRSQQTEAPPAPSETEAVPEPIVLPQEAPAMGVGRIMPAVVVPRDRLICIDPGHGFEDNGTGWGSYFPEGVYEKHVTFAIASQLDEELQKRGFQTVMTHNSVDEPAYDWDGNWIFNPNERVAMINDIQPDYAISIHVNSASNLEACGVRVYYYNNSVKWTDWGEDIAKSIAETVDEMVEITAPSFAKDPSEMADSNFAITRETHASSSLVEVGFCTNVTDAENLVNETWQKSIAAAIAEGIARFFDKLDG